MLRALPNYDPMAQADGCQFVPELAQHALDFFPREIRHVKGRTAKESFTLERWQASIVANTFGWIRDDGTRRYREVFIYVPKKNGKTALVAGMTIYMLVADNEHGAELYSAAASRDQSAIIYQHASGMIRLNPRLARILRVFGEKGGSQNRSIFYGDMLSSYRPLAADANTADGSQAHFNAIDEVHRHKTPDLADVLIKGTAARTNPLTVYTSTADTNRPSLCNDLVKRGRSVCRNTGDPSEPGYDPSFLPALFEAPKDADWRSPKVWKQANPNYGVTLPESYFRTEAQKCEENPSLIPSFKRLHLNIVTDTAETWIEVDKWDACMDDSIDLDELCDEPCYGGLDLSTTVDLTSLQLWFPESRVLLSWMWIPEANAEARQKRDKVPYVSWVDEGHVEATEGNVIDYNVVRSRIVGLASRFKLIDIGYDPYNARHLALQLHEEDGIEMVEFRQGFLSMNEPSKEFERIIQKSDMRHPGNPCMRWMVGNMAIKEDESGNIKPDKKRSADRIDGPVAAIMAIGRSLASETDGTSVYDERDMVIL